MTKSEIDAILLENERRQEYLQAHYDPITGQGGPGERVLLEIKDFAIPKQWVPKEMLDNGFIKELVRCGSIKKLLAAHKDDAKIKTPHDVEIMLRRIRHQYDFTFWAFFCWKIKQKGGGMGRFILNRPQLELLDAFEKKRLASEPIDVLVVKARQWGGSTLTEAYHSWLLFKHDPNHSFTIAAHILTAAETIKNMMTRAIAEYPAWDLGLPEDSSLRLAPGGKTGHSFVVKDQSDTQVFLGEIYIGTAEKPDTLRSKDIAGAHYSEVGIWPDTPEKRPEDLIADISGGILKVPLTMQVMESSAKSSDDYFHDMYVLASKGESSYTPLFIPWYHIKWDTIKIKDRKAFVKWLIEHKDDDKPDGKWRDSGKHYWWLWTLGATLEGINWYRYKRLDYTTYAQMANEAPSTAIEAFQAAGTHVFDIYEVEAMRMKCKDPYKVGRLISNDRRDRGVLKDIQFIEQSNGNLSIWEFPDDSPVAHRYVVAVDIGGPNPTSDWHSVRVMDRLMMMPEYNGNPAVVAEMHYHCLRDDLVYDAVRLAAWYNNALLVIESNTLEMSDPNRNPGGDGSQYVLDLAAEIYPYMYCRESPADQIVEGAPKRYGFQTNVKTKPMILDNMQRCLHDQLWDEPSVTVLEEMAMYIEDKPNHFSAPAKKHDDALMATAILLHVAMREMPMPKWIEESSTKTIATIERNIANF